MRIISLVPHATELLFALGAGEDIVAVTHECDYPQQALKLPRATRDALPANLSPGEIDAAVRARTEGGQSIYELDEELVRALKPDLIVTQALCPVCAVSYSDVERLAERLDPSPRVIALDPHTLGEVLGDMRTLAEATGHRDRGVGLIARASGRVDQISQAVAGAQRARVVALEWLDPVFVAGHWTPQLIELAGGEDVLGFAGEPSQQLDWDIVVAARPQIVVVMPCGFTAPRALQEARAHQTQLAPLAATRIVAVDGSAYFSRPGPRLIEGLELLAHILHPTLVTPPAAEAIEVSFG